MSTEENKAVMHRLIEEAFNKGNMAVVDECTSADYIFGSSETKGPEAVKQTITTMRTAFPDFHQTLDDMVAEGDMVAHRFTMTGTFKGEYMGMAPTGKQFKVTVAAFTRFEGGKQVQGWLYTDSLAWYQQLGIPIPSQ